MPVLTRPPENLNLADDIARIIGLGDRARFRDFAGLKSGWDYWSARELPELRRRAGDDAAQAVRAVVVGDANEAAVLRWHLRGLPVSLAIRKVKADAEIHANALAAGKANGRAARNLL